MPHTWNTHIGARIAEQRKLAHLTQRGLADRAHVSHSLLSKVEAGQRPASPALIAACARALGIEASVLAGQPYADVQRTERFDAPLAAIRASLENWDMQLATGTSPRSLDEVAADVRDLGEKRRRANYLAVATDAPGLIDELAEASTEHEGSRQERAHRLLAYVYRCVHDVVYGLGHIDLSRSVLFRMQYSAERSGDPYMIILTSYLRGQSCFNTGRHEVGLRLMERALADVEDDARRGQRSALCVQGNLRLRAAMLAARSHAGDEARAQWAEAWETAERLGGDTENYVMSFGPSNTKIHSVALEVELGEFGQAVKAARNVHLPEAFAAKFPDRVGHHYIDLARAQLETGQRQAAFASLQKARKAAPQQTRFHPSVKETVTSLMRAERDSRDSVTGFARWMGV
ncbi:helix-turn-helix domain-containing protein [Streptomyces megasporus]|uniref:helix-turn-helix domain-containing protein n=1 Tax=Streptomyces megasporus TaxID=44060 RepID=UPI0004E10945|nr:helix-turn-helix transcriptional regulator [Streptomyces megasporus]